MRPPLALGMLALIAAACGASSRSANGCFRVFYLYGATRGDIRADIATLRADPRVVAVRYISADEVWKQMLRHRGSPPFDPPQDSLRVRTSDRRNAVRLVRAMRARRAVEGAGLFPLRRNRC